MEEIVETMGRFVTGKKFETTVGFPTIPVQNIVATMARFLRGKKFETTVGFPTIPVQKIVENMATFLRGKTILKQRLAFQESQCKKLFKLWLDV